VVKLQGQQLTAATEEYDGTSWTSVNSMTLARSTIGGAGTQTAALAFGGYDGALPPNTGATEEYDGTSWTTNPASMNTARGYLAGAGTQASALAFGGGSPAITAATEEWTGAGSPNSYNHSFLTLDLFN
jgi:hypothetical protein